jgi:hypothetical protein
MSQIDGTGLEDKNTGNSETNIQVIWQTGSQNNMTARVNTPGTGGPPCREPSGSTFLLKIEPNSSEAFWQG